MQDLKSLEQAKLFFINGLDKLNANNLVGAEKDFELSLKIVPNRLSTVINLSIVLIKLNKLKNAEKLINEGLLHHPQNRELLMCLVEIYKKLIIYKPDYAEAYTNLGNIYLELNMNVESLDAYNNAIILKPDLAEVYSNRGNVLQKLKKYEEALDDYDIAITFKPDYAEAYSNKGNALKELYRYQEAVESQNKAIDINPLYAEAYYNNGIIFVELKQYEKAIIYYEKAITLYPNYAEAYSNKSLIHLLLSDFKNGWYLFEWRWKSLQKNEFRNFSQPLWLGNENIQNKTILLFAEQGLGDTIQFCRYVKLVKKLGANVLLEVPKPLLSLLDGLEGVDQLIECGHEIPTFDFHCPLLSLPLVFNTTLESIPECPKFKIQGKKINYWTDKLGRKKKFRVGLVWNGGFRPNQPNAWGVNERRNLPLDQLVSFRDIDAEFFSLQKGEPAESEFKHQIAGGWVGPNIKDFVDELVDFTDTAALIMNLDLVIAVDTSTAHLAASLGKPVWLLNRFHTCWRWLLDREDSPWYPSIKIYRQPILGDWESVMRRIRHDLIEYLNNIKPI